MIEPRATTHKYRLILAIVPENEIDTVQFTDGSYHVHMAYEKKMSEEDLVPALHFIREKARQ